MRPADLKHALGVFASAGYRTEITDTTWLAKVFYRDYFMDLLFVMPRQRFLIDDNWFSDRSPASIPGVDVYIKALE